MPHVASDIDRDYILRDEAAVRYGVVDHAIEPSPLRTRPTKTPALEPASR
ncbi:MAG: hypothetical protein ACRD2W_01765 [Acidimicrobiales bacterium]